MFRPRILAAVGAVMLLAACGGDDGASTASGGDGMTLSITSPGDGDDVSLPFTVELDSSEELGPTEDGVHHVHLYWDGDDSEYTIVEADSAELTEAPDGEHTLTASLRNADHSPAGVETEITLNVGAGGGTDGDGGVDY
jgi:hypothetical protein